MNRSLRYNDQKIKKEVYPLSPPTPVTKFPEFSQAPFLISSPLCNQYLREGQFFSAEVSTSTAKQYNILQSLKLLQSFYVDTNTLQYYNIKVPCTLIFSAHFPGFHTYNRGQNFQNNVEKIGHHQKTLISIFA